MPRIMKAYRWQPVWADWNEWNTIHAATASKARYEAYILLSDCCPEIEFSQLRVLRNAAADITLPDEHPLVATLSKEERHIIAHAYGSDGRQPSKWGYRNHYCTNPKNETLNKLTGLGLFRGPCGVNENGETPGWSGAFFYLTDLGEQVALSMIPTYGEHTT